MKLDTVVLITYLREQLFEDVVTRKTLGTQHKHERVKNAGATRTNIT